ncbi:MAG TPA: hypothetical protein VJN66_07395 [Rhodanobacteraceae bacterium]|nr:hypothetical protein [Rhodanobacteraceae bacterium]
MTHIVASAPGKLVLLGEYAVLEDAPALVLAVDRRASATLTPSPHGAWEIVSPTLGLQARLQLRGGHATWNDKAPAELEWIATLLARFPLTERLSPCRVELDSDAFHLDHGGARTKLGLGSSAALTVAVLGALHAHANLAPPTLNEAIEAHRAIQHGHGSGIDIAASLSGGLSRFQLGGDGARLAPMKFPEGLRWCCAYSGRPASTRAMLATVAGWREREPAAFAQRTRELATISSRGIDAVIANDAAAFMSSLHDYAGALARFGEAAGADIASREHRAIAAIAADCGCVYKSCGAGDGDVGVTFAVEDTRLRAFAVRVAQAGYPVIDLAEDPTGLVVASND